MLNQPFPDFKLPATGNKFFRLSALKGKLLVIDRKGLLQRERRAVKVPGHAHEVLGVCAYPEIII